MVSVDYKVFPVLLVLPAKEAERVQPARVDELARLDQLEFVAQQAVRALKVGLPVPRAGNA